MASSLARYQSLGAKHPNAAKTGLALEVTAGHSTNPIMHQAIEQRGRVFLPTAPYRRQSMFTCDCLLLLQMAIFTNALSKLRTLYSADLILRVCSAAFGNSRINRSASRSCFRWEMWRMWAALSLEPHIPEIEGCLVIITTAYAFAMDYPALTPLEYDLPDVSHLFHGGAYY